MHHSSARDNQLFIQQHFRKGVLFVFYCAYSLASCGSQRDNYFSIKGIPFGMPFYFTVKQKPPRYPKRSGRKIMRLGYTDNRNFLSREGKTALPGTLYSGMRYTGPESSMSILCPECRNHMQVWSFGHLSPSE